MSKWFVEIEVDEEVLRDTSDASLCPESKIEDAIHRELGWCEQSGIAVKSLTKEAEEEQNPT